MEARKEHQRQMAGTSMGMLLKPSRGPRDDILLRGGKPKDHTKDNRAHLRELAKANERKKQEAMVPPPQPFRLAQFSGVPSKITTRRNSPTTTPSPTGGEAGRPESGLSTTAPSTTTSKNFISINAKRAITPSPRLAPTPAPAGVERKTKLGTVPRYLVDRKLQWAQEREDAVRVAEEAKIPKGMMVLPDRVRLATLASLQKSRDAFVGDLGRFPVVIETPRMIMRKAELDKKIAQLEASIESFSKCTVLVDKQDYAANFAWMEEEGASATTSSTTSASPAPPS